MADASPLLSVRNLEVRFKLRTGIGAAISKGPTALRAVDDVSFDVKKGEALGLVGESGSGKTTIGKALLRLYEPQAGQVIVNGVDITHMGDTRLKPYRRDLQMVFQDPLSSLNPRHTVRTALATPLLLHKICRPEEVDARIDEALSKAGLPTSFKERYPHEMSGGQLQRVAIARALTMSPGLVVADEPVSKLDVSVRAQILNLLKDLQERFGISIIFITHDLRVARYLCHRIAVMYFGKMVEIGPTEELFRAPKHPYTKALLGTIDESAESLDGMSQVAGEAFNPTADTKGCRYYSRCPMRTDRCAAEHPSLETIVPGHDVACYEWRRS
ncbi:MAG: ABC transporter ATP-binding protein [Alphaproteobacteria bacterium]|nr:ABC transporter ATP-binding protein [Alphaproteobacteria bacterium]